MAINVLSLDFDFYQRLPLSVFENCYPQDGEELGPERSIEQWERLYEKFPNLYNIKINRPQLDFTKQIIRNTAKNKKNVNVMIALSHVYIFEFIRMFYENGQDKLKIYNVDMHHDMFQSDRVAEFKGDQVNFLWTTSLDINCGNWVTHVLNIYDDVSVPWICNPISKDAYYCDEYPFKITTDLKTIEKVKFDAIFLCRSDEYIPPHLDPYFKELRDLLLQKFPYSFVQPIVLKDRDFGYNGKVDFI